MTTIELVALLRAVFGMTKRCLLELQERCSDDTSNSSSIIIKYNKKFPNNIEKLEI